MRIYTDGSCLGNPGPGGWAWADESGVNKDSGYEHNTTNQRMELKAVIEAIHAGRHTGRAAKESFTIVTDSAYVVNCFKDHWYRGWTEVGIKKRTGEPVANWDLWSELIPLVFDHHISFEKVKGHSGDPMNDFVDIMARDAAECARN